MKDKIIRFMRDQANSCGVGFMFGWFYCFGLIYILSLAERSKDDVYRKESE